MSLALEQGTREKFIKTNKQKKGRITCIKHICNPENIQKSLRTCSHLSLIAGSVPSVCVIGNERMRQEKIQPGCLRKFKEMSKGKPPADF